jgi:hypothetical protein
MGFSGRFFGLVWRLSRKNGKAPECSFYSPPLSLFVFPLRGFRASKCCVFSDLLTRSLSPFFCP